ncbi:hypothetical protein [Rhodobacter capsulatus]|jgi:hypothetical protein|uniref:Uncharacterized protein n=1 Tax=Rhodobacter phage RcapNL TaxID=1131316 RepID=H6WBN3_9CAUD|nr:hypothetical protein [Rhodobacter capsulatus]YP_007518412.1 hypothetical protein I920_gp30 [Rhodobacter phage RcapNL]AFA44870.1 hypothetical protein RcapNL_00030 [Rhodobacter phage RcapNL]ETD02884.1 hypothetical protein U714_04130 [Rhodobacter capsulatus DE442]ETD79039.1 hypothetical protein U717_04135 [Rhodobacter capsulatus R121]ETE54954.1 hypothetical protein U715_04125 [Rhodobacter capsulatus Y262]MDS0926097.1 hypothetical protein [Rhodobacter capsulatus]
MGLGLGIGLGLSAVSRPALGQELLANWDFSAGSTGWTVSGADATHVVTFVGGAMRYQSDSTTPILNVSQVGVITIGKTYTVEVKTSNWVSGSIKTDGFSGSRVLSAGIGTVTFTAVASASTFTLTRFSANVDLTLDSISIREVL